jgi:hypothetical protein
VNDLLRVATQRTSPEGQEGLRSFLEKREPGGREGDRSN